MAPDPGPLWNHRGGQQRLGYSSLEFLTDLAAAFGPKRVFSSVEWVMKLLSKKKKSVPASVTCLRSSGPITCRSEHEGRIPRNHRPARKDEESPGTGPMIEGKSDSEKGSWLFKPRVFFQFEFFSLRL